MERHRLIQMGAADPQTRSINADASLEALSELTGADYRYACQLTTHGDHVRTAEDWARAVFEGAPSAVRGFVVAGWVVGLRLQLGPRPSPSYVLGWSILSNTPETVVLATESPLLTARLVVQVQPQAVVHATFVGYKRRLARVFWAVAAPIHRLTIPYLLRHARRSSS
jgi:hypothetical protein